MSELSELLERLRKSLCLRQESEDFCRVAREDVEIAMDALEAVPVWVKCSERMPEAATNVLVCGSVLGAGAEDFWIDYAYFDGDRFSEEEEVVYWMLSPDLPAPPIVEQGEK